MLQLRSMRWLNQKIKIKGMYTASLNPSQSSLRGKCGTLLPLSSVLVCIKLVPMFFSQLHTVSHIASCIYVWPPLFFCSQGLHSNNFQSHASVWFSSALFGSVQAASGTSFMYNNQRGCNHTCESARLCACVCMCVYSRQTHWSTGLLPTWFACLPGQKYSTVCLTGLSPCCRWPVLGNDGGAPPHHRQVVCAHWSLLGLFPQVLVFVITQPWDGLKIKAQQKWDGDGEAYLLVYLEQLIELSVSVWRILKMAISPKHRKYFQNTRRQEYHHLEVRYSSFKIPAFWLKDHLLIYFGFVQS